MCAWCACSYRCRQTLRDHVDAVNSVCFQPYSVNLCTGSGDKTVSMWDLRCVCACASLSLCSCVDVEVLLSRVSGGMLFCELVDLGALCGGCAFRPCRSGTCVQTFYGHNNAVNGVAFSLTGDTIASCDADGIVKLWDVRVVSEKASLDCGDNPVNKVRPAACRFSPTH
jgi:WD40 repeat protein